MNLKPRLPLAYKVTPLLPRTCLALPKCQLSATIHVRTNYLF